MIVRTSWKYILSAVLVCTSLLLSAQNVSGIRGVVTDKESGVPLTGVNVKLVGSQSGSQTDINGEFEIADVPLGRQQVECSYVGYQTILSESVIVNSARVAYLNIQMAEGVTLDNVEIIADGNINAPINELATVSARSFSVEETERIAAGVNDMGRMALSYPGVQQGGDDSENDIIIRGNSSVGILWRLEGIDIPNPNHFARPGSSGGGVTIFSAQLLSKSDFYTGGMPAEFGNALSGAFDINFRAGNMKERQHKVRIGVLGLDAATEGPIKENESSYLINYRYSTLGILNEFGIHLVGDMVSNNFQDLSFNIVNRGKDPSTKWTVFGLGGLSKENYFPVADPKERDYSKSWHWEDRIQASNMATIGTTYTKIIDDKSYIKGTTAVMIGKVYREFDTLSLDDVRFRYNTQDYLDRRISTAWTYRKELSDQWKIKTGAIAHGINYTFFKETKRRKSTSNINDDNRELSLDGSGNTGLFQVYGLTQYSPMPRLQINMGLHAMYLGLNGTAALDPRLSLKYEINSQQHVGLALGRHSQILPLAAYFYTKDLPGGGQERPNFDAGLLHANHYILSHTYVSPKLLKFSTELYCQQLSGVPVSTDPSSTYWMLNNQSSFPEEAIVNDGTGTNYGVDLAMEKFFSNKFYFLLTGSFFQSNYALADGQEYKSRFSTDWVSSLTIGREFEFRKGRALQIGARAMYNGGARYTPHDPEKSAEAGYYVPLTNATNTGQSTPYFRIDTRCAYRYNTSRFSGSVSLDIQNVTANKNQRGISYDATTNSIKEVLYPGGDLIPILSIVFDF